MKGLKEVKRTLDIHKHETEIRDLLTKYKYNMINKANSYEGEITTLNEHDVNHIVGDMKMSESLKAKMWINEDGMVVVEYPNNVCRLESGELIKPTIATTFWTPYTDHEDKIGKEFLWITEKKKDTYDYEEVGDIYIIEFDGGVLIEAFPEEIFVEYQNEYKRKMNARNEVN
jgi:hypothetical protein